VADPATTMAEIAGIARDTIAAWSQHSTQLRQWAAGNLVVADARQLSPAQLAVAQKATRSAKPEELGWAELRRQWRADERGEPSWVMETFRRTRRPLKAVCSDEARPRIQQRLPLRARRRSERIQPWPARRRARNASRGSRAAATLMRAIIATDNRLRRPTTAPRSSIRRSCLNLLPGFSSTTAHKLRRGGGPHTEGGRPRRDSGKPVVNATSTNTSAAAASSRRTTASTCSAATAMR
jgi:TrwC relaxase